MALRVDRQRPEQTMLYCLVQQHAQAFFAQIGEAIGVGTGAPTASRCSSKPIRL